VSTGRRRAFVDVVLAQDPVIASGTVTHEGIHSIHTDTLIDAWVVGAVVQIGLAELIGEARDAEALKALDPVYTLAPIQTWSLGAVVDVGLAQVAIEAEGT